MIVVNFVWLEHPETGGKAQFADAAVDIWTARGWRECDPPDEPDLTKDPAPDPAEEQTTQTPPSAGSSAADGQAAPKPSKPAKPTQEK